MDSHVFNKLSRAYLESLSDDDFKVIDDFYKLSRPFLEPLSDDDFKVIDDLLNQLRIARESPHKTMRIDNHDSSTNHADKYTIHQFVDSITKGHSLDTGYCRMAKMYVSEYLTDFSDHQISRDMVMDDFMSAKWLRLKEFVGETSDNDFDTLTKAINMLFSQVPYLGAKLDLNNEDKDSLRLGDHLWAISLKEQGFFLCFNSTQGDLKSHKIEKESKRYVVSGYT